MALVFYTAPWSSATPVESALTELDVPHERVVFELAKNPQKHPDFLKLNPNGKVPTLVVDGTPLFEALAILHWLGDRYGVARRLWPAADAPARLQALSWSTWAYVSFAAAIRRFTLAQHERVPVELHNAAQAEAARRELTELLDILEAKLTQTPYLLGAEYSLADLIVASCMRYAMFSGVAFDRHTHVSAWVAHCYERPALRQALS